MRRALSSFAASRWPLLLASASLAVWCQDARLPGRDRSEQLALELARDHGLVVDPAATRWAQASARPGCWRGGSLAWLSARTAPAALRDIYLVRASLREDDSVRAVCSVHNLSRTQLADEVGLITDGPRAAWRLENQGHTYRVELRDSRGDDGGEFAHFGALARLQQQLTAWQETGQLAGITRRSFRLEPAATGLEARFEGAALVLRAAGLEAFIPEHGRLTAPSGPLQEEPRGRAQPSPLLHWALDRARASRWLGVDRVQRLKIVAQSALQWLDEVWPGSDPFEPEILLDDALEEPHREPGGGRLGPARSDQRAGWPPAPLETVILPVLEGEGQWRRLQRDPFVKQRTGLPPPVITTFIRPDRRHRNTRVLVALWDPRRLDLRFATGTEEPRSETGEVGSGMIPRDPELLSRLVGAFNGGFQTAHGGFGTFVEGRLYVPPRPFAATVARFVDGSVGFGTWPLSAAIPEEVESFRQNLTPLVSHGVLNPYQRTWWGGVPVGWMDTTRSVRTALCLTQDGFVGYFYGSRADHEALGRALQLARCEYGLHLDMNSGHTGFEFYSVVPASTPPLPPAELATRWKAEGFVPELPSLRFRARRLFRNMQLMHFPRYIQRQTRDFFYLVERDVLPRSPLDWQTEGEFPFPSARRELVPDPSRPDAVVTVIELDLKWLELVPAAAARPPAATVFSVAAPTPTSSPAEMAQLWISAQGASVGQPAAGAFLLAGGAGSSGAAWCLIERQLLAYAEIGGARDALRDREGLERAFSGAGCRAILHVEKPSLVAVNGSADLGGAALDWSALEAAALPAFHFVRREWTARRPLFPSTPVVAPATWQPHQP